MRIVFILVVSLFWAATAWSLDVWAIGEGVRINPLTGKAFEDNPKQLPGAFKGDYRAKNLVWDGATKTVSIKGAVNEVLAFQLILEGPGTTGINVSATDLKGPGGAAIPASQFTFFRAFYINTSNVKPVADSVGEKGSLEKGWYADPLVPLDTPNIGAPFAIDGSNFTGEKPEGIQNQTVWVDLWIPNHTPKGTYKGTLVIHSSAGIVSLNTDIEVFGFILPDEEHVTFEFESYKDLQQLPVRDQIYIHAHQHRATITMADYHVMDYYEPRLTHKNGKFIWEGFDKFYGPGTDGSLYKTGPRAGVAAAYFNLPFGPAIERPDKKVTYKSAVRRAWPILNPTKNDNLEVDFTPEYVAQFSALLKDASEHFAEKYPKTTIITYNDNLDEAGFQGPDWARRTEKTAMALLRTYQGYAKIFKSLNLKNVLFKLDMGSGFSHCGFDLDGDGKMEGPKDVVDALPDIGLWAITAGRIRLKPLEPVISKGIPVWFYNSGRRIGSADILHEGVGPRTWPWVAWNSNLSGMMKYECLVGYDEKSWEKGGNEYLFFYPGKDVGVPGKVFVSVRLKAFRRGLQDYEYLYLLAQKDGKKERANSCALQVVQNAISRRLDLDPKNQVDDQEDDEKKLITTDEKDTRHWSHDIEEYEKVRCQIGKILGD